MTGQLKYTADLYFPGMLYGKILFSPVPHAKIKRIDTSKASALPGVHAVLTYENTPQIPYNSAAHYHKQSLIENEYVFSPVVRFVGDRVAAVAAETSEIAEEALRLIEVEYEDLPAVYDMEEALAPGAPLVYPEGNIAAEVKAEVGEVDNCFKEADFIFTDQARVPMAHHAAMEPHVCLALCDLNDKISVYTPSQNIYPCRALLAKILNLPMHKIRVIKPPMGGSFGSKQELCLEPVAALLAFKTKRPVKLVLNRRETMISTRTRYEVLAKIKTAVSSKGEILAQDLEVLTSPGAYASSAMAIPNAMCQRFFRLYRVPALRFRGISVYTNRPIAGPMRGYGSPQLIFALETHLNRIAKEMQLDPVEFRLKHLVRPGDKDPRTGISLGNCRVVDCLERGRELFQWHNRLTINTGRFRRGVGVACGLHGNGIYPIHHDLTTMTLKLNEDGTAILLTGTADLGTGCHTGFTQIIGEVLGIEPGKIEVLESDTDFTPYDTGCFTSRSIWVAGNAAKKVAEAVLQQLQQEAAKMLNLPAERLKAEDNHLYYLDNPSIRVSIEDIVNYAMQKSYREIIATETYRSMAAPCPPYAVHFAEVEVDTLTGKIKVKDYVAVHDIGQTINPLAVEGQIEGAIQMGISLATQEKLELDQKSGKITNASFKKYHLLKAKDMPRPKILLVEEGEEPGPFGAKSIGEAAVVPVPAAVISAISDALGVNIFQMPVTAKDVLEICQHELNKQAE